MDQEQKSSYHFHPSEFWDSLSEIRLTRDALRELDRRNSILAKPGVPVQSNNQYYIKPEDVALRQCSLDDSQKIKVFSQHGGPDLTDLRGFPRFHDLSVVTPIDWYSLRSRSRESYPESTTTMNSGPYDHSFQQDLIDGGVYPFGYEYPDGTIPPGPRNSQSIRKRLAQRRPSLTSSQFTEEDFRKFQRANIYASKEQIVKDTVIPILEGKDIGINLRYMSEGVSFKNLAQLTEKYLVPGNPDRYYGACPEQLNTLIRTELGSYIVPSTQADLPIIPNFFLEVKGPDGNLNTAQKQACYYGALGARGFESLRSYGDKDAYDNNAYSFTSTYCDGVLKMFTSYPSKSTTSESRPEYFMHQIGAWALTNDAKTFRQGATWYRNARDWAKEQRNAAISNANKVLKASRHLDPEDEDTGGHPAKRHCRS